MNEIVLLIESVTKAFKQNTILVKVNLAVEAGEIVGLLGSNGAGKTSLLRIVTGLVYPDTGKVTICGFGLNLNRVDALSHLGAIIEKPSFYGFLSAKENLRLLGELHGGINGKRVEQVLSDVGLTDRADDMAGIYSLGMRQRLGLAAAMLTEPDILVLDEPLAGLDPAGRKEVNELLQTIVIERQKTALIASHDVEDVRSLCRRIVVMQLGKVVATGVREPSGGFSLSHEDTEPLSADTETILEKLR